MDKLPLSIGILSWGDRATLRHTLESYKDSGLLDIAAQVFVFFQEMSADDIIVAKEYGIDYYGAATNLGIAEGYRHMLFYVTQPYYLFLENDWVLNPEEYSKAFVKGLIREGIHFLDTTDTNVVRYRSRELPGSPLWTYQFKGNELSRPEHLLDCVHWRPDPEYDFPEYITSPQLFWYRTSSKYANWTNNPHLVETEWIKELATRFGQGDIEQHFQSWWQEQDFHVMQGEGLFTHWRL